MSEMQVMLIGVWVARAGFGGWDEEGDTGVCKGWKERTVEARVRQRWPGRFMTLGFGWGSMCYGTNRRIKGWLMCVQPEGV